MTPDPDIATFLEYSGRMMNVNALLKDWEETFVSDVSNLRIESTKESFRRGFAKSLIGKLTPQEYERATDWDFDTTEELQEHLKTLWVKFYGDANPTDSLA